MKRVAFSVGMIAAFALGCWMGNSLANTRAQVAILSGPYSDNYDPAIAAIAEAKLKLEMGDVHIGEELDRASNHLEKSKEWTRKYLGQQ